jgi:hypothetical protein
MKTIWMTAVLSTLAASVAHAEDVRANPVMICKDSGGAISRVESVALYEARSFYGLPIDLGAPSLGYQEKLEVALKRLERFDGSTAQAFRKAALTVISGATPVRGVELVHRSADDSGIVAPGCSLSAAMVTELKPGRRSDMLDVRATLNADFWDRLSEDDRAVFVLNELIRRQTIFPSLDHPRGIRYLAGLLSSTLADAMTVAEMVPYFIAGRMRTIEYQRFDLELWRPNGEQGIISSQTSFYSDGTLASGRTSELTSYSYKSADASYSFTYLERRMAYFEKDGFPQSRYFAGVDIRAPSLSIRSDLNHTMVYYLTAQFYPDRTLKAITIPSEIKTPLFRVSVSEAHFAPGWKLTTFKGNADSVGWLNLGDKSYRIYPELKIDPSGSVRASFYSIYSSYASNYVPSMKVNGIDLLVESAWVTQEGAIGKFRIPRSSQLQVQGKAIQFRRTLQASSDGKLLAGTLDQDAELQDSNGKTRLYKRDTLLHFDSGGRIHRTEANDTAFWEIP